jgi:heme exporter protein B
MTAFIALLRRDLVLAYRQGIDALIVILFFLVAGILFPSPSGRTPGRWRRWRRRSSW